MLDIRMCYRPVELYKRTCFSAVQSIVQDRRRCFNSHDGALPDDLYDDDRHSMINIRTFYTTGGELHSE